MTEPTSRDSFRARWPRGATAGAVALGLMLVVVVAAVVVHRRPGRALDPLSLASTEADNNNNSGGGAGASVEYRLTTSLPQLPGQATVYQLRPTPLTRTDASRMSKALGLGSVQPSAGGGWHATARGATFDVTSTPTSWSVHLARASAGPKSPATDEKLCIQIYPPPPGCAQAPATTPSVPPTTTATSVPETTTTSVPGTTTSSAPPATSVPATSSSAETTARSALHAMGVRASDARAAVKTAPDGFTVTLTPLVGGVTVEGLEWTFGVSPAGAIIRVDGLLVDLERIGDYPLSTVRSAYDTLARSGTGPATGRRTTAPNGARPVVLIERVQLGLMVVAGTEPTTVYVVPTYRFTGHVKATNATFTTARVAVDPRWLATTAGLGTTPSAPLATLPVPRPGFGDNSGRGTAPRVTAGTAPRATAGTTPGVTAGTSPGLTAGIPPSTTP